MYKLLSNRNFTDDLDVGGLYQALWDGRVDLPQLLALKSYLLT